MGLSGVKYSSRKLGFKGKSAGPWNSRRSEKIDGICQSCDTYDIELDSFGYCRDEDCKYRRFVKALKDGEAMKTPGGTIIWTPGQKLRDV